MKKKRDRYVSSGCLKGSDHSAQRSFSFFPDDVMRVSLLDPEAEGASSRVAVKFTGTVMQVNPKCAATTSNGLEDIAFSVVSFI